MEEEEEHHHHNKKPGPPSSKDAAKIKLEMRDFCEYHSHKDKKNPALYHTIVVLKSD